MYSFIEMSKNEREWRITKTQASKFEHALSQLATSEAVAGLHSLIQQAQRNALQSQLDELREEISD